MNTQNEESPSKNIEDAEGTPVEETPTFEDQMGSDLTIGEDTTWETLASFRQDTVDMAISQQLLLQELSKKSVEIIKTNPELKESINGLALAFKDVTDDIVATMDKHTVSVIPGEGDAPDTRIYKEGLLSDDDFYDYLQIASEYTAHQDMIANLSKAGYVDIFTKLSAPGDESTIAEFKDTLDTLSAEYEKTASEIQTNGVSDGSN